MPSNDEHRIVVRPERSMSGLTFFRSYCSCGRYRSGLHGFPGRAELAGRDHARTKNA